MKAAADAANAGTCLEDGSIGLKILNVFEHLVDAVKNVSILRYSRKILEGI